MICRSIGHGRGYAHLLLAVALWHVTAGAAAGQDVWVDPSPHEQRLVPAAAGGALEVLDWGGQGRVLVLLAQLGQTAHIYDEWAPTLTSAYRVVGITRRGFGSSTAEAPYSIETLTGDILHVLDTLDIRAPVLVGGGFAGEELAQFAVRFPARASGLVFLNAAYDRTDVATEATITRRIPQRAPAPQDMTSIDGLVRWAWQSTGVRVPEAEFRQMTNVAPNGRLIGLRTPVAVQREILAGVVATDWTAIRVPVLAIYATATSSESLPGCRTTDPAVRQACDELYTWTRQQLRDSLSLVATTGARTHVVDLPDAHAFVFLSHPVEVRQAMDLFLADVP